MIEAAIWRDFVAEPPLVRALLFALLFWWVTVALGFRILRLLGVPDCAFGRQREKVLICAALGAGFLQYLPFLLSLFGAMKAPGMRWGFGALAVLLLPDQLRIAQALRRRLAKFSVRRYHTAELVWCALSLTLLTLLFVRAVNIGDMGDDDGYHLSSPKRWLKEGSLYYLPTYTNTNTAMGFELLYALGMAICDPVGAKILHFSAGLIALGSLMFAAHRLAGTATGLVAVSCLMVANPLFDLPFLFGVAYVDLAAGMMVCCSLLLWMAWRERQERNLLLCFGICVGLAGSFKITALSFAIAWLPALIIDSRRLGHSWAEIAERTGLWAAAIALPVIPWLCRNWSLTGNPVYPLLSSVIATRDWNPTHAQVFARYMHYYSWAVASGAQLGESARKALVAAAIAAVLAGAGLALRFTRAPASRALIACLAVFVTLALGSTGLYFRYLLPGFMLASLLGARAFGARVASPSSRAWSAVAVMVLALLVQFESARRNASGHVLLKDARIALGLSTFAREYPNDPLIDTWSYLNEHSPSDAKVLIASFYTTIGASSAGGFWVDRPCFATDSHLQASISFADWRSFLASIRRLGITHVVISDQLFAAGRQGFTYAAGANEYPFCRRLVDRYGDKLQQSGHLQVYRTRVADALADLERNDPRTPSTNPRRSDALDEVPSQVSQVAE